MQTQIANLEKTLDSTVQHSQYVQYTTALYRIHSTYTANCCGRIASVLVSSRNGNMQYSTVHYSTEQYSTVRYGSGEWLQGLT